MMPALLGGLFIGVLSALPIVGICNCCCLWIVGGGVLAAYLAAAESPGVADAVTGRPRRADRRDCRRRRLAGDRRPRSRRYRPAVVGEFMRNARDLPPNVQDVARVGRRPVRAPEVVFGFLLMLSRLDRRRRSAA